MNPYRIILERTQTRWSWYLFDSREHGEEPPIAYGTAMDLCEAATIACAAMDRQLEQDAKL